MNKKQAFAVANHIYQFQKAGKSFFFFFYKS